MPIKYKPAVRGNSQVLVGLFGGTGTGKTFSALLLARGIAGPEGKIAIADSEGGRGMLFADVPEIGGYLYGELTAPFEPKVYIDAIDQAERDGVDVLVIDSMTHEWQGEGGVLAMAEAKGKSLNAWREPKSQHDKLILRILRSKLHIILCFRAKRKTRQVKGGARDGKDAVVKDDFYTPMTSDDFLFELLAVAEVVNDPHHTPHSLRVLKTTHPDVAPFFKTGTVITKQTGALFAGWSKKSKTLDKAIEKAAAEQKTIAAAAKIEKPRNDPAPHGEEEPEPEAFKPAGGWKRFNSLTDWGDWSKDWLKTAVRRTVEGWEQHFRPYLDRLNEMEASDKRAATLKAELKPLIAEAMKRGPKP